MPTVTQQAGIQRKVKKQTQVVLPQGLHLRAKAQALLRGITLGQLITAAVERDLAEHSLVEQQFSRSLEQ